MCKDGRYKKSFDEEDEQLIKKYFGNKSKKGKK